MERRARTATLTGVYLVVIAAILVAINIFAYGSNTRFDATESDRFTLSEGSKRLVSQGLSKDLQVDFYVTRGLTQTDLFIEEVRHLLSEYADAETKSADGQVHKSKFKFSIVEPKTDEEKKAAKDEGLTEQLLHETRETADNQHTVGSGYLGFVLKYGSEKEVIPFWPPHSTQGIEFFMTNKIREVRDRAEGRKSRYGIITGKDEIKISDSLVPSGMRPISLKQIFGEYFPFYEFEEIDLKDGETEIDSGLIGVIVTQPQKDFTEKELRRIDEFLMRGNKALVVMASAVNLAPSDKDMKATLDTRGLDKLLMGYGVEMQRAAALDFGSAFQATFRTTMGEVSFQNPGVAILEAGAGADDDEKLFDDGFHPFFRMPQIPFPFPSPLVLHKDKQPKAEFKVVARTSPRTSVNTSDTFNLSHRAVVHETDPQESKIVGVTVEGELSSAFVGADNMGIHANPQTPAPSRVLVLSSAQYLANPFTRSGNPPPLPPQLAMMAGQQPGDRELSMVGQAYLENNLFITLVTSFKGMLDWMANDADLLAVNRKLLSEPALTYSMKKPRAQKGDTEADLTKKFEAFKQEKRDLQTRIKGWLLVLPAFIVFAFGIIRWALRSQNRDKIHV